jgi:hypothetical protein
MQVVPLFRSPSPGDPAADADLPWTPNQTGYNPTGYPGAVQPRSQGPSPTKFAPTMYPTRVAPSVSQSPSTTGRSRSGTGQSGPRSNASSEEEIESKEPGVPQR